MVQPSVTRLGIQDMELKCGHWGARRNSSARAGAWRRRSSCRSPPPRCKDHSREHFLKRQNRLLRMRRSRTRKYYRSSESTCTTQEPATHGTCVCCNLPGTSGTWSCLASQCVNRAVDLRIVEKILGMQSVLVRPVAGRIRKTRLIIRDDVDRSAPGQVMRNRAYIPDGQNRLTRQLTLERKIEVLCLRIYCVRIDPSREGIQGQVPIRRSKRHVARRPGERKLLGMVTPVLMSWNGLAKLGFGAPDVLVENGGAPRNCKVCSSSERL